MFGVFLLLAALQGPWSATPPRPTRVPAAAQPRGVVASARPAPRPRLDIDLSGLSDDDAIAVPGFSPAATRPSASRDLVWSPRLGQVAGGTRAAREEAPVQRQVSTLALAPFGDDAPGRIDPAIGDLIGSVPLPVISNPHASRPRLVMPVATRSIAGAAARRYEPGRW